MTDTPPETPAATPPATPPTEPPPAAPPTATQPTAPADPPSQGDPADLGDAGKRALQAEREARAAAETELGELRAKVQEFEDQGKTEIERLTEANAMLTAGAQDFAKLQAAMAKAPEGTTPDRILALYPRLQGKTPEELEADAEALFAQFSSTPPPATTPTQPTPGLPVETLQPGAPQVGQGPGLPEQIRAAEEAGDWSTARRLKSQMTIEAMENRPS